MHVCVTMCMYVFIAAAICMYNSCCCMHVRICMYVLLLLLLFRRMDGWKGQPPSLALPLPSETAALSLEKKERAAVSFHPPMRATAIVYMERKKEKRRAATLRATEARRESKKEIKNTFFFQRKESKTESKRTRHTLTVDGREELAPPPLLLFVLALSLLLPSPEPVVQATC